MILNAYSVLAVFAAVVELALGAAVVAAATSGLARWRRDADAALGPDEARVPLAMLLAFALAGASLASWPLLYLLLDSYVPQWAGVMCVEGVSRIGTGSVGAPAHLPRLVALLEATKPALVFASGTWLVLHLANRSTRTAPYTGRVLGALLATGALAVVDAGAQLAYLVIPKRPQHLARGCCTSPTEWVDPSPLAAAGGTLATPAFFALTAVLAAGTWLALARRGPAGRKGAAALLAGAVLSVPVGLAFLGTAAPRAFAGPDAHACAYCLVAVSPLATLGIVLYLTGAFGTAWASIARLLAPLGAASGPVRGLRYAAFVGWTGSLLLVAARMAAA